MTDAERYPGLFNWRPREIQPGETIRVGDQEYIATAGGPLVPTHCAGGCGRTVYRSIEAEWSACEACLRQLRGVELVLVKRTTCYCGDPGLPYGGGVRCEAHRERYPPRVAHQEPEVEFKPAFTPLEWARPPQVGEVIPSGPKGLIAVLEAAGWQYRVGISKTLAHDVLRKVGDERQRFDLKVDVYGVMGWSPGLAQWVYASWYRYEVPPNSKGTPSCTNKVNQWNAPHPRDPETGEKKDITITEVLEYVAAHAHTSTKAEGPPAAEGKNDHEASKSDNLGTGRRGARRRRADPADGVRPRRGRKPTGKPAADGGG